MAPRKAPAAPKPAPVTNNAPPVQVELLPLPEGAPDSVQITCNGRGPATFVVRQQRVLFEGKEMSASRFEALCGRADAKKWKTSLFALDGSGEPGLNMGDWLDTHGFDKSTLQRLANNFTQWEAYQSWAGASQPVPPSAPTMNGAAPSVLAGPAATEAAAEAATHAPTDLPPAPTDAQPVDGTVPMELEVQLPTPGGPSEGAPRSHALVLPDGLELPEGTLLEIPLLMDEHGIDMGTVAPSGADVVDRWVRVFWPTDGAWYEAHVRAFREEDRRHRLWYKDDGSVRMCC